MILFDTHILRPSETFHVMDPVIEFGIIIPNDL